MVLCFGLTNALAIFMTLMHDVFKPFLDDFVTIYIDDILIYSKDIKDHKQHLEQVLQKLQENKLYAKEPKCQFAKDKVKFLGHIIGKDGI